MSSRWRGNSRTWLLLVLGLLPTVAVLVAGVWLWARTGDELAAAEAADVPMETTVELFKVSSAVVRLDYSLAAAAAPGASEEAVERARADLAATTELLSGAPERLQDLISRLSVLEQESAATQAMMLIGQYFGMALGIVEAETAGAAPSQQLQFLTQMARENAGGLVLPTESRNRDITFLAETISSTIAYDNQFSRASESIADATRRGDGRSALVAAAQSPLRDALWADVLDSRKFAVGGIDELPWQLTKADEQIPVFLDNDEPLVAAIEGADLSSISGREDLVLELLAYSDATLNDVTIAYRAAHDLFDQEVNALRRERLLTAIASIIVSIVGLSLLGLTLGEVRARERAERAHADAIEQLADKAHRDPTTGAWNRRRLERDLGELLQETIADPGSDRRIVLAYIDLDSFKPINDVWGHHTGDRILRTVTDRLSGFEFDGNRFELIRFGGDEFVLYATVEGVDNEWLERLGEEIVSQLGAPMSVAGRDHAVGASAGITHSDEDSTLDSLLLEADSSLILAKRARRGTAIVYDRSKSRTGELVHALPTALAHGEIICHLQPVFDMRTGRVSHAEALARWVRPDGETVSPAVFVPLIESFGLAEELTANILRNVAAILERSELRGESRIWINLSPRELEVANFADRFRAAIIDAGAPPQRLGLEITETAAVRDPSALAAELALVRRSGVLVAIDDFGSGYSPLGFLRELPVDVVKLDRSLITDVHRDPGNQSIVTGIVGYLRELGVDITAEGVEQTADEAWLVDHGVFSHQGFLRGHPVLPESFDWAADLSDAAPADAHYERAQVGALKT
ncbi:MAG: bifunctional diguanylate cyclase/phosphodiesterase [Actinomycetota bacterium]